MDWNKTKSIFILVFLVLNLFLYFLYVNRHNEVESFEVIGEEKIEQHLKEDHITYETLPSTVEKLPYISGRVKTFEISKMSILNQAIHFEENGTEIVSIITEPIKISNIDDDKSFIDFIQANVFNGSSYKLWNVDREKRIATFFQEVEKRTVYYNKSGLVQVYWNEQNEIIKYKQTMLEQLETLDQDKEILPPISIIQALYSKNLLKPNSQITSMKLGYSTLVQLTQKQVFAPTWEVRVKSPDGTEEFFINAFEGKVIEFKDFKDFEDDE